METRSIIAYLLMAAMILTAIAVGVLIRRNTRDRRIARARRRQTKRR